MKITKRQLRRIIREEKTRLLNEQIPPDDPYASVGGPDPSPQTSDRTYQTGPKAMKAWDALTQHLSTAGKMAGEIDFDSDPETWRGTESNDLADLLEGIWTAAGFDPSEIFK